MPLCEEKSLVELTTGRPPHRRDGHRRVGGRRGGQPQRQEEGRYRSVRSGQLCFIYIILSFGGKKMCRNDRAFCHRQTSVNRKKPGPSFNFRSGQLQLKTRPKQLLGLLLDIMLPNLAKVKFHYLA
jgi:hypothetical protein